MLAAGLNFTCSQCTLNYYKICCTKTYKKNEKTLKNEQRNRNDAAKKELANTSGVGESNNYYEDIYNTPPYNNTH